MIDYLKFDGGKAVIAEIHSCQGSAYVDLSKVCAISTKMISLKDNKEEVSVVFDGGIKLAFILNVDVYDELLTSWLYVKTENKPTGDRYGRDW